MRLHLIATICNEISKKKGVISFAFHTFTKTQSWYYI